MIILYYYYYTPSQQNVLPCTPCMSISRKKLERIVLISICLHVLQQQHKTLGITLSSTQGFLNLLQKLLYKNNGGEHVSLL